MVSEIEKSRRIWKKWALSQPYLLDPIGLFIRPNRSIN